MKAKGILLLCFFLIAGVVLGGLAAQLTKNIHWLTWLSYGNGVDLGAYAERPLTIDLAVIKMVVGIGVRINVGQIIGIIVALILNRRFGY